MKHEAMKTASGLPAGNRIYEGVILGPGTRVEAPCVIGLPRRGEREGERVTSLGRECVIRPFTTIYAGVQAGDRLQTGQGASIREDNVFGADVSIGTNAVLEHGNRLGNRVRIHTGCFLELVTIEDDVFIGPNVVFTDDAHPPCPRYADCRRGALVASHVSIGANSTILPGVAIGRGAVIGAGSVVTKDVPAAVVVAGNPARTLKGTDEVGCEAGFFESAYRKESLKEQMR